METVKAEKVLVVGGGGREHAMVETLRQSLFVREIMCAPGNPGIAKHAECFPIPADDIDGLLALAQEKGADLTLVGPEKPLADGIVDRFNAKGLKIIGPTARAAQIEASKCFCKELLRRYGIPTADFATFDNTKRAKGYISRHGVPVVIKPDGLTGGKGVVVARDMNTALDAVDSIMATPAGNRIVVEEYLEGEECSYIGLTDGKNFLPFPSARDYKEAFPGGPMTGGMVSISPVPEVAQDRYLDARIKNEIVYPLLRALREEGRHYRGIPYVGLMLTPEGPKILEVNCRGGDPETQATWLSLRYPDILPLLLGTINSTNNLAWRQVEWKNQAVVCLVLASKGYPGPLMQADGKITGLEEAEALQGITIFHAGTRKGEDGNLVTAGGRVLNLVGNGGSIKQAAERVREAIKKILFPGMWYREDILKELLSQQ